MQVPEDADIVICAGDAVEDDLKGGEYDDFIEWFAGLDAKWKIRCKVEYFCAGES